MIGIKTHKGMIILRNETNSKPEVEKGCLMERKAGILQEGKATKTKLCSA